MVSKTLEIGWTIFRIFSCFLIPVAVLAVLFGLLCLVWFLILRYHYKMDTPSSGPARYKKPSLLRQILVDVPRRYMLDYFQREPGYFYPRGIHMFCGEQGAGKTIAAVEMIIRLQKQYPLFQRPTKIYFFALGIRIASPFSKVQLFLNLPLFLCRLSFCIFS